MRASGQILTPLCLGWTCPTMTGIPTCLVLGLVTDRGDFLDQIDFVDF
jgi:hypothetical protein